MTTYNSYEEAKIANPESEIVTTGPGWDGMDYLKGKFQKQCNSADKKHDLGSNMWLICNPYDHCMTVKKFLSDGHKFQVGDLFLGIGEEVVCVDAGKHLEEMNIRQESDTYRFILRAAALDKPKRVKVEYVQEKSFKEVLKCAIDGESFYSKDGNGEFKFDASRLLFVNHNGADVDISHLTEHCFYRKVETEIDERQEFIDEALKLYACNANEMFGKMYDAGCRFAD